MFTSFFHGSDYSIVIINEYSIMVTVFAIFPICVFIRQVDENLKIAKIESPPRIKPPDLQYVISVMKARPSTSLFNTHQKWGPATIANRRRGEFYERASCIGI